MTDKSEDKGLEEIRRMLRSLDEISASEPKVAPTIPPTATAKAPEAAPLRPQGRDALATLASTASSSPPQRLVPPPPAVSRTAAPKITSPSPLVIGLAGIAVVGGAAMFAAFGGGGDVARHVWQAQRTAGNAVPRAEPAGKPEPPVRADVVSSEPAVKLASAAATAARSLPPSNTDLPPAPVIPAATPPNDIAIAQGPKRDARAEPPRPAVPAEPAPQALSEPAFRVPTQITVSAGGRAAFLIEMPAATSATLSSVVLVRGLPTGVTLSRGRTAEGGVWAVTGSEVAGLELVVPAGASGTHTLGLELRSRDGVQLAAARTRLDIPVPGAPLPMADAARPSDATLGDWLTEGKRLIAAGHIASARLILERAADGGSGEAARTLGDTYDPAKLYVLGVRGIAGDVEKAVYWYERADELGDSQAKARLLGLSGR